MSLPSIEGLKTISQLRAEQSQSVVQELDRNAFLRLFTAQLQNQNPIEPMKNEAFVAQLAQFSTLEATTTMSASFGDFVAGQQEERMLRGANLLGKQIFAPDVAMHQTGGVALDGVIQLDRVVENLRLYVVNAETSQIVNHWISVRKLPVKLPLVGMAVPQTERKHRKVNTYLKRLVTLVRKTLMYQPWHKRKSRVFPGMNRLERYSWKSKTDGRLLCLKSLTYQIN